MTLGDAKEHLKQCGESGGIRPGRSLWATAARGARLEQLMRWQHHSFPTLWPRNTSNSPTCVLKSSIKDFRGIATKIRHILTPGCAQALLFKCLSYPLIRSGNSPSKKHKSQLKYSTSFVGSVTGDALKITRNARARSQKALCSTARSAGAGIW